MPAAEAYIDTSALIKWYVAEPFSEEVEQYLASLTRPAISSLTILEWHCALGRRQREGAFSRTYREAARREFARHLVSGYFQVHPVHESLYEEALGLLNPAFPAPLSTLDTLHLAIAQSTKVRVIATADRILSRGAKILGFDVVNFFPRNPDE